VVISPLSVDRVACGRWRRRWSDVVTGKPRRGRPHQAIAIKYCSKVDERGGFGHGVGGGSFMRNRKLIKTYCRF